MTQPAAGNGPINPNHNLALAEERLALQAYDPSRQPARRDDEDDDVIDLREYWHVLVRRKGTIFTVIAVALVVALLATFLATPIYRSSLLLQIERESGKVLEYESITPEEAATAKDFYQTQYELLRSRTLARRVIDQLGLQASSTFSTDKEQSGLGAALTSLKQAVTGVTPEAAAEPDIEELFLENLSIAPVKNSRLVEIHYDSPSPEEAARIANAVAENFINTTLERRFDASSYAKSFLEERIQQVRANLEDSERKLVAYAREREIVNLDDKLDILMQRLKDMNKELVAAEAERIEVEAEYNAMAEGTGGSFAGVLDSPVVQALKARKQELENEYEENLKVFKPGYPKMQQLQQQIAEVNQEIAQEAAAIQSATKNRYAAKVAQEAKLQARIAGIKEEILALQDRSTDYQTLKREVETNRELYDGLLQRMKEIGVVAGISTNNISIVDPARVPQKRYKPSLPKNLAIALALGLFGGILLAFLFETLDDTVKTGEELEKHLGLPLLGIVPDASRAGNYDAEEIPTLAHTAPNSALAEAYRSLRTALIFSTPEGAPKILHFTSSGPGEGKTTSAVSVAVAFAQTGGNVLLIDADLRNPSLQQVFELPNTAGLTNYLTGDMKPSDITLPTAVPQLFVMPSGPLPPNPVELLGGPKMMDLLAIASQRFDFVVLDSPPVLGLADALVLASMANATVFCAAAGSSRLSAVDGSVKRLRGARAHLLGGLLTKFGQAGTGYGYDYHYSYHYQYGTDERQPALGKSAV